MKTKKAFAFISAISAAVVLIVISLVCFMVANRRRITAQNREYLMDSTEQIAGNIDAVLQDGYDNIRILSNMVGSSLKTPEVDIVSLQTLITDSVFDFMEFADADGMDHNITGGVSDARDREYYLEAMKGNVGCELIFNSRATHETLLMYYSPIVYDNRIIGSLIGAYQAKNRITKLLTVDYFDEEAESFLYTPEGRLVAASNVIDTNLEQYIWEIAGDDEDLSTSIKRKIKSGDTYVFALPGNETGCCIYKLSGSGYYLAQIFPENANRNMIHRSSGLGMALVLFLMAVFAVLLIGLINFFRKQQAQIEEANNAKTTFLFNMSHDIRTPMNAIIGYTTMAKTHIDDKSKVTDCLSKIQVSGQQLLSLINQVLDMSRIESGKIVLEENPIDIVECLQGMLSVIEATALKKDIVVIGNFDDVKNRNVVADVSRLNQMITNVLGNAIKYTPEGGRVRLRLTQLASENEDFGMYSIAISDTGIGMSEDYIKHIFDPFSREKNSTVSKIEGTGLGMSIVKRLSDIMGGALDIESTVGLGTTVTITLPLKHGAEGEGEASLERTHRTELIGKRVLLVEDVEMNREIACDILTEHGLIVDTADDGDTAVDRFRRVPQNYYDFILMDVQMPRMNGY